MTKKFKTELQRTIEYNSIFSKTAQGVSKKLADSKWMTKNDTDKSICPVTAVKITLRKKKQKQNILNDFF